MRKLNLDKLKENWLGIPPSASSFYYTALLACLQGNGHQPGCLLKLRGEWIGTLNLSWKGKLDKKLYLSGKTDILQQSMVLLALLLSLLKNLQI